MGLTRQSQGALAVSLPEFKLHAKVDQSVEDALLAAWLRAAQDLAEGFTGRTLTTETWTLYLDEFPVTQRVNRQGYHNQHLLQSVALNEFLLPKGPNPAIASITYRDLNGDTQTLATDQYELDATTGRVRPTATGSGWPGTYPVYNAVAITFTVGYGDAGDVPETIKAAIRVMVTDWAENRERPEVMSEGAKALLMSEWNGCYMPETV